jgi:hypothetical protein
VFDDNDSEDDDYDEGPPVCMLDCPGIENLGPDSDLVESCAFFTSISMIAALMIVECKNL